MRFGLAASTLAFLVVACSGGGDATHTDAHEAPAEHAGAHAPEGHGSLLGPTEAHAAAAPAHAAPHQDASHWGYDNQAAWERLAGVCANGQEQSPVNLSAAAPAAELPDLNPRYVPFAGTFVNNGHTLQFTPEATTALVTIGPDAFNLVQFHFHSPAEHTLDRRAYPLELHFVHRNSEGQLAVVGVFIEEGVDNPALAALLAARPTADGESHATQTRLDPASLLPQDRGYYAYAGSLTTPPCTQGVRWNVLRTPIQASRAQIAALREALGASSRHVQDVGQRTVLYGS